jgi:5S rRNA maturation endonuclease (ribonuclease M5)
VLKCHVGCSVEEIVAKLGLKMADLFDNSEESDQVWTPYGDAVEVYSYTDETGNLLFQVCRTADKQFPQRRPDPTSGSGWRWNLDGVRRVLYRLPQVREAIAQGTTVYVVEGEKDVHAVEHAGATVTCNPSGAGHWRQEYAESLRDAHVIVVADNDEPGRRHAQQVFKALQGVAASVKLTEPAVGKDVHDHLTSGLTLEDLEPLQGAEAEQSPQDGALHMPSMAEILQNPSVLEAPQAILSHLAWPGRVTLLAAREKLGKSTLAAAAAAAASAGRLWLGSPARQGNVLWVGLEEHMNDMIRRFMRFKANPACIYPRDRLPHGFDDLEESVKSAHPVLIVIDSLAEYSKDLVSDQSSSAQWQRVMSSLVRLAREYEVAILLLHHGRKSDGSYRDSSAIAAAADMILEMHAVGGQSTTRRFKVNGRWTLQDFRLNLDGDSYTLMGDQGDLDERVWLFVARNERCSKRQVRDGITAKDTHIDKALERLLQREAIQNVGSAVAHSYVPARCDFHPSRGRGPGGDPATHADNEGGGSVARGPLGVGGEDTHSRPRNELEGVAQTPNSQLGDGPRPTPDGETPPVGVSDKGESPPEASAEAGSADDKAQKIQEELAERVGIKEDSDIPRPEAERQAVREYQATTGHRPSAGSRPRRRRRATAEEQS